MHVVDLAILISEIYSEETRKVWGKCIDITLRILNTKFIFIYEGKEGNGLNVVH